MLVGVQDNVVIHCDPQKQVGVGATHGSPVLEIDFVGLMYQAPTSEPRFYVLLPACYALFSDTSQIMKV